MSLISLTLAAAAFIHSSLAFDRQALSSWFTGLNPDKVVHAINCGSNEDLTDLLGVTYSPVSNPLEVVIPYIIGLWLHGGSNQRGRL